MGMLGVIYVLKPSDLTELRPCVMGHCVWVEIISPNKWKGRALANKQCLFIIGQRQEELSTEASNTGKFLEMYRSMHGVFR